MTTGSDTTGADTTGADTTNGDTTNGDATNGDATNGDATTANVSTGAGGSGGSANTTSGSSGGGGGASGSSATTGSVQTSGGGSGGGVDDSAWLHTDGNRILTAAGAPFRGRGANLHDTRSCDACTTLAPNPEGLMAWGDELTDNWGANFIRFNLWSFRDDGGFRAHWQSLLDDPDYYEDVQAVVNHLTSKPGVYVMVTVFIDASMIPDGELHATWPTQDTLPVYEKLAEAFVDNPQVLFGLMNEPHDDASENDALADIFQQAIQTIRAVEDANGTPQHIIVAQATQLWARDLSYWIANPLGENIAYEVHVYNPASDFEWIVVEPSAQLPMIIGEFGHHQYMTLEDAELLMQVAEENGVPWLAWNFHQRCDPNLIQDVGGDGYDGCGFEGAGTVFTWQPTEFGNLVKQGLARPW